MMTNDKNKKQFDGVHYIDDGDAEWIAAGILKEKTILKFINFFNLQLDTRHYIDLLGTLKTVTELQAEILVPVFEQIFQNTSDGISASQVESVDPKRAAVFISNHRDIVLDSAVMNLILFRSGRRFANAGIGDNLLMNDAVQILFNMMKCFVIKRSLPGKKQVQFLRNLSDFIAFSTIEKNESIWIAQASGRAKDGDDRTNPAVLKMLSMSKRTEAVERLQELNIHTTTCSYEWDPCDVFKVRELLTRNLGRPYQKQPNEDMISIHAGICESKGRVHVTFNRLSNNTVEACRDLCDREFYATLAGNIDAMIHRDYCLWPSNYIAADLLEESDRHSDSYTSDEKGFFLERMNKRLSGAYREPDLAAEAKKIYLTMYANPVYNNNKVAS